MKNIKIFYFFVEYDVLMFFYSGKPALDRCNVFPDGLTIGSCTYKIECLLAFSFVVNFIYRDDEVLQTTMVFARMKTDFSERGPVWKITKPAILR